METGEGTSGVDVEIEVKAMGVVAQALGGLDAGAQHRVLDWAVKRFGVAVQTRRGTPALERTGGAQPTDTPAEYADLATLYAAVAPTIEADKVLVAAYWQQIHEKKENLDGQAINSALKNLGHGIGNVTRACGVLMGAKPALMMQVKKTGSTPQARKLLRLTDAGVKKVREMLAKSNESGDGEA